MGNDDRIAIIISIIIIIIITSLDCYLEAGEASMNPKAICWREQTLLEINK